MEFCLLLQSIATLKSRADTSGRLKQVKPWRITVSTFVKLASARMVCLYDV